MPLRSSGRGVALTELPVPDHGSGQARRAVAEVLAREEYAELRPGLIDRLWAEVLDGLGRLLDLIGQTGQAGLIGTLVFAVVAALLAFGAVRLIRRIRPSPRVAEPQISLSGRSARDWSQEASAHESAGHWREAVRCHHRALVAELVEAGLVEDVPGRTAAEHEAEAAASVPDGTEPMGRATRLFERAWYATTPVTAGDVYELHRAADMVRQAAGLRVPAGQR